MGRLRTAKIEINGEQLVLTELTIGPLADLTDAGHMAAVEELIEFIQNGKAAELKALLKGKHLRAATAYLAASLGKDEEWVRNNLPAKDWFEALWKAMNLLTAEGGDPGPNAESP